MLDLIAGNHFSGNEPGVFAPILDALIRDGDTTCTRRSHELWRGARAARRAVADQEQWWRKAVLNIAVSRGFSSDRTIAEYATDIWRAEPWDDADTHG